MIDGVPGKELEIGISRGSDLPWIKIFSLDESAVNYSPVCFDGESIDYMQKEVNSHYDGGHYHTHYTYAKYSNAQDAFVATFDATSFEEIDNERLHAELDKIGGNAFCNTW